MGIVAGWGRLSEGGQLPNILQYVSNTSGTSTGESAIIVCSLEGIGKTRPHPSSKFGIKKEGHAPLMQQQFPMDSAAAGEEQRHRASERCLGQTCGSNCL